MLSSRVAQASLRAASASSASTLRVAATSGARFYAAPAATDTKPPVALFGVDGTYASALVSVIKEGFNRLSKQFQSLEVQDGISDMMVLPTTVHRSRQVLDPRLRLQSPEQPFRRLQEGHEAADHPQRAHPLGRRQVPNHRGAAEAHRRRRQGRHGQELPRHPGGEQQARYTGGRLREVWDIDGCL